jgi:hypothetical protein
MHYFGYILVTSIICVELDPLRTYEMHSVTFSKLGVTFLLDPGTYLRELEYSCFQEAVNCKINLKS